jgi:hypothetical protein
MAGPFLLLTILIMLVMMCTTTGQPTGPSDPLRGNSRSNDQYISTDEWETKRKRYLRHGGAEREDAKYGHSDTMTESIDLESPCAV